MLINPKNSKINESINAFFFADKPESVSLDVNISSKICARVMVKFTCTADANPPVNSYKLYENNVMIETMGTSGVKTKLLDRGGQFIYRCEATNTLETTRSSDTNLTVEGKFEYL